MIHDRNDKEIPLEEGLFVAKAWPGATMLVTERFGHRRIMLAAEVVRAVVDFLRPTGGEPVLPVAAGSPAVHA